MPPTGNDLYAQPPADNILQEYLPDSLKGRRYYEPGHQGKEASIKKWLEKQRDNIDHS